MITKQTNKSKVNEESNLTLPNNLGKAYTNRKSLEERPAGDFYPTPTALTLELLNTGELSNVHTILEPCCGQYNISNVLTEHGFSVESKDLIYGNDFLTDSYANKKYDAIVTNPPFSLWDDFLIKAKTINCNKIIFIGKTNFFGSHSRTTKKLWENLSDVYIFDRQIAYDRDLRSDNKLYCGNLITGWFVWTKNYTDAPRLHIIDMQKWIYKKGKHK